jgi:hypothetical protein
MLTTEFMVRGSYLIDVIWLYLFIFRWNVNNIAESDFKRTSIGFYNQLNYHSYICFINSCVTVGSTDATKTFSILYRSLTNHIFFHVYLRYVNIASFICHHASCEQL